ncbi:FMRFamide receptor-like [Lineus longissimus]|uniref:FMRFamide receptor-like n=2 Tax=Lineus longissimus TaxID=88925 RepID=UPI00315D53F6
MAETSFDDNITTTVALLKPLHRARFMPQSEGKNIAAFVGLCPVLLSICIFGFFGNTLSFVVMFKEKHRSSSNFLMQALAIADNFVLLFFIVHVYFVVPTVYDFTLAFKEGYDFQMLARNFTGFGLWLSKTISIYIVVYMTAERTVAVCLPFKAVTWCSYRNAVIGLLIVIIFSIMYNLPKLWYYHWPIYVYDPYFGYERPKTVPYLAFDALFSEVYITAFYFVFIFVIPLTLLVVMNTKLILTLRRAKAARGDMAQGKGKKGDKITEKIVGVVTAFIVLEFPSLVANAALLIEVKSNPGVPPSAAADIASRLCYVLSATNSFINFFIYCLAGEKFRRQVLCLLGCAKPSMSGPASVSTVSSNAPNGTKSGSQMPQNGNSIMNEERRI